MFRWGFLILICDRLYEEAPQRVRDHDSMPDMWCMEGGVIYLVNSGAKSAVTIEVLCYTVELIDFAFVSDVL
jgi:hypothetical protein